MAFSVEAEEGEEGSVEVPPAEVEQVEDGRIQGTVTGDCQSNLIRWIIQKKEELDGSKREKVG
ncbi:hypothetical protein HKBW3S06_00954 [Candidatus Hakubella thermalkaliphila]|uniref:Uncharacterized protein n=1 Tax=Candidatus Hakubella thermalkaliphila TaxID=2754717 RepID=A0A6V8NNP5_9ACTN|nr:hypothetical protein [Candidatus Hakubella thermalkaliphila]GFP21727.1 hypothetical protein HKBW3S06_00954 [Candidatus Hakubella thermalkaliphila]